MSKEPFYCPCVKCKRNTRHLVLEEVADHGDEEYQFTKLSSIIECQGCEEKGFRTVFRDIENTYPVGDDEWVTPEDIEYYPKYNPEHVDLESTRNIPEIVGEIYAESMLAVQAGALTLAGLGLRGTIEAVCNERSITGRNLEVRIGRLATQGLISAKDAERLHAIRFLGNDAAHDIKKPSDMQISVALKIINHLIQSVYLLEAEMHRRLDTIISDPDEFELLLGKHIKDFTTGDEFPLAKYLGKDMRRLGQGTALLEAHLIASINAGTYTNLKIGKLAKYANSKSDMQHFIIS